MYRKFITAAALFVAAITVSSTQAGSFHNGGGVDAQVGAHSTKTYEIGFTAGEPALLTIIGDRDTDLDIYVYDQAGNLVASDTDRSDWTALTWVPRRNGIYTIKIKNLGGVYNSYRMRTN